MSAYEIETILGAGIAPGVIGLSLLALAAHLYRGRR